MTDGYTLTEIANELERPPSWVSERLSELRSELALQTGIFFPLADHEYDSLRGSIRQYGVRVPIVIGSHIALIDGRHRCLVAQELELGTVPAVFLTDATHEEERAIAIALNAARRQLNRQQKRILVQAELMRDPERSDRWIAAICGVTHPTVGIIRAEIAQQQTVEATVTLTVDGTSSLSASTVITPPVQPAKRATSDGKMRTVTAKPPVVTEILPAAPEPKITTTVQTSTTVNLGYVTCSHGQVHELHRDPAGTYSLVASRD